MLDKEIKEKIKEYYNMTEYAYENSEHGDVGNAIAYGTLVGISTMLCFLGENEFLEELGKNG